MPYQVEFDSNNRILRARLIGDVTDDDLRAVYRFGQQNVMRLDPLSGITDFSDVTGVAFSAETMRELARLKPIMPEAGRPVVFVAPTPELFGMARMFAARGRLPSEPTSRPNGRGGLPASECPRPEIYAGVSQLYRSALFRMIAYCRRRLGVSLGHRLPQVAI